MADKVNPTNFSRRLSNDQVLPSTELPFPTSTANSAHFPLSSLSCGNCFLGNLSSLHQKSPEDVRSTFSTFNESNIKQNSFASSNVIQEDAVLEMVNGFPFNENRCCTEMVLNSCYNDFISCKSDPSQNGIRNRSLFYHKFNCINDSTRVTTDEINDDLVHSSTQRERTLTNQTFLSYDSPLNVSMTSLSFSPRRRAESDASAASGIEGVPAHESTSQNRAAHIHPPSRDYKRCVSVSHDTTSNEPPPPYSFLNNDCSNRSLMLSEDEALDAFRTFVTRNCCYNPNITKKIRTKQIAPCHGHQYVLETFYEERSTSWHQEPLTDQTFFSQSHDPTPSAWEIAVKIPIMFYQTELHMEIPNTASANDCSSCLGKGLDRCISCNGKGEITCIICDGIGLFHHSYHGDNRGLEKVSSLTSDYRHCHYCNGGKKSCTDCTGNGKVACKLCQGKGRVKMYLRLTVKWKTLKSQKVIEQFDLPSKCIYKASGAVIFQEQSDRVYPLIDFPIDIIRIVSQETIENHSKLLSDSRIIKQRHFVREIPVYEVHSVWGRKELKYWVYGNENDVYCQEYPEKCFAGCSLL